MADATATTAEAVRIVEPVEAFERAWRRGEALGFQVVPFCRDLEGAVAFFPRARRVAVGAETCERLLPDRAALAAFLGKAAAAGVAVSLETPFLGPDGFEVARSLVAELAASGEEGTELVANDWGLVHHVRRSHPDLVVVLGRLLVPQMRDFSMDRWIASLRGRVAPAFLDSLSLPSMPVEAWRPFLEGLGIGRVELSAILPGLRLPELPGMCWSLHAPLVVASASRNCAVALSDGGRRPIDRQAPVACRRACLEGAARLENERHPRDLWIRGNALVYPVEGDPPRPEGVDRLVLDVEAFHDLTCWTEGSFAPCASS